MLLNNSISPINTTYNSINSDVQNNLSTSNINFPVLLSSVLGSNNLNFGSILDYEYEDSQLSSIEEGLFPKYTRNLKKKNNKFLFSFLDKGKKINKIVI